MVNHPLHARWRYPAIALLVLVLGAVIVGVSTIRQPPAEAAHGEIAAVYPPFRGQVSANRFSSNHYGAWGSPIDMWQYNRAEPVVFRASSNVAFVDVQVGRSCEGGNTVTVHMYGAGGRYIGNVAYRHIYASIGNGRYYPPVAYGLRVLQVGTVVTNGARSSNCWTGPHAHVESNGWPIDYSVGTALGALDALYLWSL